MFSKNSKAYSVYLLFRFVCSLAVSMSTVLSIVYHLEVVQLDAFQLVLVGTVQETSCFLFEMPTGVVADLYSRRRSVPDWNVPLRPGLSDGGCATVVRAGSAGPGCLGLR